jgi:hypothetical protein
VNVLARVHDVHDVQLTPGELARQAHALAQGVVAGFG